MSLSAADPGDDGRQHVGELGGDDQQSFGVGLGRGDLQQRDQFAGVRQPVLDQAVVRELGQFLDPQARVAQHLNHRPGPEAAVFLEGQVAAPPVWMLCPDAAGGLGLHHRAAQRLAGGDEQVAGLAAFGGGEQLGGADPFSLHPGRQRRQHREPFPGALVHA